MSLLNKSRLLLCLVLAGLAAFPLTHAHSTEAPSTQGAAAPVNVIFDTDIWSDIDDALALAMVHALHDRGELNLVAITISTDEKWCASYVDLIDTFYGHPQIPIGIVHNGFDTAAYRRKQTEAIAPENGYTRRVSQRKNKNGSLVYPHRLRDGAKAPEAVSLLRKTLAAQPDGSVVMIQVGYGTNLARLLDSEADANSALSGRDLVRRKVTLLSIMGGNFEKTVPEWNLMMDIPSAQKVFADWPTPVVASGWEIGAAMRYPGSSIQSDYAYVADHPIPETYRLFCEERKDALVKKGYSNFQCPHDHATYDLTSVLYAARPDRNYFSLSKPGKIAVLADGSARFEASEGGLHRYLILNEEQKARTLEAMVMLASQPPGAAEPDPDDALVGVRVLKQEGVGDIDWSVHLPKSCSGCRLQINEFTSHENTKEFYFHIAAPKSLDTVQGVRVKVDPAQVRGVLAGRAHIPFNTAGDGINFDVPLHAPPGSTRLPAHSTQYERTGVSQLYTYIDTPAVQTRIEHADEQRRYGSYATGSWPALERQAALNLQFAARQAITTLGLDVTMEDDGLGTILLMGFDTNFPTLGPQAAHGDFPPHWHMHVWRRVEPRIHKVGHFYIGSDGLLTDNASDKKYTRGETDTTYTPDGKVLYTHTITPEGYFVLGAAAGQCRFTPVAGGFHTGVDLACDNGAPARRIRAEDDVPGGRLRLFINDRLVEEHFYDPDNGVLKRSEIAYEGR